MKKFIAVAAICILLGATIDNAFMPKFYDGEGNVIPYNAVDALVRSQFVDSTTEQENDLLIEYFYTKHE